MRQVPYAIVGSGRMARHMKHYFSLLQIPFLSWKRADSVSDLQELSEQSERILLLISDSAIEPFIESYPFIQKNLLIHFSGCLHTPLAYGVHPLSTFTHELYDSSAYENIPFVFEDPSLEKLSLFPDLPNPFFSIRLEDKSLYHSLCVLSGNFTSMLWSKAFRSFEEKLKLPSTILYPYLQQICSNLQNSKTSPLTGPIARNDTATIQENLHSLKEDAYFDVYQAFLNAHQKETL